MAPKKCLQIGAGGMAGRWLDIWTQQLQDRVAIAALVDTDADILNERADAIGLPPSHRFTDYQQALANVEADFCAIVTPPQFHSPIAIAALDRGLPVLCEKPIADTLEAALALARKAKETALPCAIIQNYRYAPNKQEVVRIRDEGRLGRLQHIVGRYACDYRQPGSWGKQWRHDMDFGLLFEGSVHHFDMLRFLSGGDCETLQGFGWNPAWSSFRHFSSGFYLMRMDNGVHTAYEGNSSAAGLTNCWHKEYYRAEFEEGTVEIAGGDTVTVHQAGNGTRAYEPPPVQRPGHDHLLAEFVAWLEGGPPAATRIEDNIQSYAMVIAAMEATLDNQPKRICDYLQGL